MSCGWVPATAPMPISHYSNNSVYVCVCVYINELLPLGDLIEPQAKTEMCILQYIRIYEYKYSM